MSFLNEIRFNWGFGSSELPELPELEKLKAELEKLKAKLEKMKAERNFRDRLRDIVSQMINAPNDTLFTWDFVNGHQVQRAQSIQNLHPKKTEKVNWQKEGF